MRIVTLGNKKFIPLLQHQVSMTTALGYKTWVYDMGGLGYGKKFKLRYDHLDLPKKVKICLSKPHAIRDAFELSTETVVYLDGDAFLLDRIDEIEEGEYDVGLTYKGGRRNQYVNAGVLWFRNTEGAHRFLNEWIEEVDTVATYIGMIPTYRLGDNIFLNRYIWNHIQRGSQCKGRIRNVNGIRVKFFPHEVYNSTHIKPGVKIVHFKNNQAKGSILKEFLDAFRG